MGFLNKILKSLGFEDEKKYKKPKKIKEKKQKTNKNITASFNLQKDEIEEKPLKHNYEQEKIEHEENIGLEVVKVKSQPEVQAVINKIKNGGKILINIENLSKDDIVRSLDFLSGAVFALNLSMQKIDDKIYLIQ